jgi:hypothetical protein
VQSKRATSATTESDQSNPASAVAPLDMGLSLFLCSLIFLIAAVFFMFDNEVLRDGDSGWHLAAGRYIVDNLVIPTTDPFSYTFQGQPWVAHEWLAEVAMYGGYAVSGWSGVVVLYGLAFAITLGIILFHSLRWLTPAQAACLIVVAAICVLPSLLARPHTLAWPFVAMWTVAMMRARENETVPSLGWAIVMLLWANLHGSYAFGLFLAGTFAFEALVHAESQRRLEVIRTWGLFGIYCLVAAVLTPSGPAGLYHPIMVSTMEALPLIGEWGGTNFAELNGLSIAIYILLFFCLFKPVRVPIIRILLLIFLLHMALTHLRHHALFAMVGSLILAEPLARAYRKGLVAGHPGMGEAIARRWRDFAPFLGIVCIALAAIIATRIAIPLQRPNAIGWPGTALARLPPQLRNQRVFNEYSFGGALVQEGIPVFIDGRADMYGDKFVKDYVDISMEGNVEKWHLADKKWGFRWTILGPNQTLTKWLEDQPEWERIYADKWSVVYVRKVDRQTGLSAP